MDIMHPVMAQCLAPFAPPPSINDDDVVLVDLKTLRPITTYGSSSASAEEVRRGGLPARLGQGWMKGMQLRHMQAARAEVSA